MGCVEKKDVIMNNSRPHGPYRFSIILTDMIVEQVLNCIQCGIKKVLISLKLNLVNPAETLNSIIEQ